eukprot:s1055_g3.t1
MIVCARSRRSGPSEATPSVRAVGTKSWAQRGHSLVHTCVARNLASNQYKQFLTTEWLTSLTKLMEAFPNHVELLTNIARILSKLTLHSSAVEAWD